MRNIFAPINSVHCLINTNQNTSDISHKRNIGMFDINLGLGELTDLVKQYINLDFKIEKNRSKYLLAKVASIMKQEFQENARIKGFSKVKHENIEKMFPLLKTETSKKVAVNNNSFSIPLLDFIANEISKSYLGLCEYKVIQGKYVQVTAKCERAEETVIVIPEEMDQKKQTGMTTLKKVGLGLSGTAVGVGTVGTTAVGVVGLIATAPVSVPLLYGSVIGFSLIASLGAISTTIVALVAK
jgi:hypothetical protein